MTSPEREALGSVGYREAMLVQPRIPSAHRPSRPPRYAPATAPAVAVIAAIALAGCAPVVPTPSPPAVTASTTPTAATPTATPMTPTPAPVAAEWTLHDDPQPDTNCTGPGDAAAVDGALHVYVSIADQHLWECSGQNLVMDADISTGAVGLDPDYATPTGTFAIAGMVRDTELVGHDSHGSWDDSVAYWMPFDDEVGFHDASWQTFPFGSSEYLQSGSHGCVHMPLDAIAHLYDDVSIGTPVTIRS